MTKQKQLGQYFTPSDIARTLVEQLRSPVNKVIELGAGQGALARAINDRFPNSEYLGVEVDESAIFVFKELSGLRQNIISADVFNDDELRSFSNLDQADTIVGNPPFISCPSTAKARSIINHAFPSLDYSHAKLLRAELYFLSASISRLIRNGQGSFILPISLFTSPAYKSFRYDLVTRYADIVIIHLPVNVFANAEVEACILKFRNTVEKSQIITIAQANLSGEVVDKIEVQKRSAVERMDYTFNKVANEFGLNALNDRDTLGSIGCKISRGSASRSSLEKAKLSYFHTSSFPDRAHAIKLGFNEVNRFRHACAGDILIPRVGSRCLDRQVHVTDGQKVFTDCVYKLTVSDDLVDRLIKTLSSDFGRTWRLSHANGKCAKFLTNATLFDMPLLD